MYVRRQVRAVWLVSHKGVVDEQATVCLEPCQAGRIISPQKLGTQQLYSHELPSKFLVWAFIRLNLLSPEICASMSTVVDFCCYTCTKCSFCPPHQWSASKTRSHHYKSSPAGTGAGREPASRQWLHQWQWRCKSVGKALKFAAGDYFIRVHCQRYILYECFLGISGCVQCAQASCEISCNCARESVVHCSEYQCVVSE